MGRFICFLSGSNSSSNLLQPPLSLVDLIDKLEFMAGHDAVDGVPGLVAQIDSDAHRCAPGRQRSVHLSRKGCVIVFSMLALKRWIYFERRVERGEYVRLSNQSLQNPDPGSGIFTLFLLPIIGIFLSFVFALVLTLVSSVNGIENHRRNALNPPTIPPSHHYLKPRSIYCSARNSQTTDSHSAKPLVPRALY